MKGDAGKDAWLAGPNASVALAIQMRVAELRSSGRGVIALHAGDPDLPPHPGAAKAIAAALSAPGVHRYPQAAGDPRFREAVAEWYQLRFGVSLDAHDVLPTIGAKEALAHLPMALLPSGGTVLGPEPGYPTYRQSAALANAAYLPVRMTERNGYRPDFSAMPDVEGPGIWFVNYPSNPTGAVADGTLFEQAIKYARDNRLLLVHDNPYSEIFFGHTAPPSPLKSPDARGMSIELGSCSKMFNLPGWRLGWVVGAAWILERQLALKSQIDSGVWQGLQLAAAALLTDPTTPEFLTTLRARYKERRDVVVVGLREAGFEVQEPAGGMYVWVKLPVGQSSVPFSERLLLEEGVAVMPGTTYGTESRDHVRVSLTAPQDDLRRAVDAFERALAGAPDSIAEPDDPALD